MHSYNILKCSLISTQKVYGLGKGKHFSINGFVCPFLTIGFVTRFKWSVITLFGRVMNNNVVLFSDWLFHSAAHCSSSVNRSLLSGVNDGEIWHPTLYV